LADKPILLVVSEADGGDCSVPSQLDDQYEVVRVETPLAALSEMARRPLAGVYVDAGHLDAALQIERLLESDRILEGMPDGVVLLDSDNIIIWGNGRLREWGDRERVVGENFYSVLGSPEIIGPDFCPFHTVLATGKPSGSTLRTASNRYYQIHAAPVCDRQGPAMHLVVTVRDVTNEMLQQQKLEAIHRAGIELADLTAQELSEMSVDERIDLLKSNILHYTQHLLSFDVVEIRLLDQESNRLSPLLSYGMTAEAATRELYASPQNNGVTGFVAATGKSYLCEDTTEDPLYLLGSHDAKSSLTVPLVLHDKVIGSFNVESPHARAFTENDLQFLEIFSRDVAVALNTLELLVAEKASTTLESVEAIHSAVALPVDEILNEAVNVMERYIGHEPQVVEQLQRILRNARDIKQVIQQVGQQMAPAQAVSQGEVDEDHERLCGRRMLVVDEDENVRSVAHNLLERYGCIVETAHDGNEAMRMVRATNIDGGYDVILADIRLPDMSGYEFLVKLKEVLDHPPLTLMTGFGYDPGHSLVKARQAGCMEVLYKPFRVDQLLETMIRIVTTTDDVTPA
jgi:CheY-like chemotaxis protein